VSTPRTLTHDELAYLCSLAQNTNKRIVTDKGRMVPGSLDWQYASVAESATGWLAGWLQEQLRSRAEEFFPELVGDLDQQLRELLEDGDA